MSASAINGNGLWQGTLGQRLALLALFANLMLIGLFPPHDYVAMDHGNMPTFEGFRWVFSAQPNRVINTDFLWLELLVVLINFFVAWLLLLEVPAGTVRKTTRAQRVLLVVVAINLLVIVLFPPFENFMAISKAVLPSFEGFYFVLGNNAQRQIVTPILYLEIAVVLINAALLWLFVKERAEIPASSADIGRRAQGSSGVQKP